MTGAVVVYYAINPYFLCFTIYGLGLFLYFPEWQYHPAVDFVEDLAHCNVNSRQPADDAFPSCKGTDRDAPAPIANGEEPEQYGKAQENELYAPVLTPCAEPHEKREKSPHKKVPGHEGFGIAGKALEYENKNEGPPEKTV